MFKRIIVPLDGSDFGAVALPAAEELARLAGAPIHLVRVLDTANRAKRAGYPMHGAFTEASALQQSLRSEKEVASAHLRAVKREIHERGLTATIALEQGAPAAEIVATTRPGDVVVMATHGRGGLGRWFLGSIAEEVVRQSIVPVMLVRMPSQVSPDRTALEPAVPLFA